MFWQDPLIFWSIMVNFLINYQCAVRKQAKQKEKNKNGQVRIYLEAKRRCTMSEKMIENNKVSVIGEIVSGFTFSHEVFGEGFYMVDVAVNRLSEQADIIPLMVSERLLDVHQDYSGSTIEALGQFRSYNRHEGVKNRLMLSIFVREVHFMEEFTDYTKPDIPGRLYLQAADLPQNSSGP